MHCTAVHPSSRLRRERARVAMKNAGKKISYSCIMVQRLRTHLKDTPQLLTEDHDESIDGGEEEDNDHKTIGHDDVAGLHLLPVPPGHPHLPTILLRCQCTP